VTSHIIIGDVRAALRSLPDDSVHCAITSPPYWNLRSYLPDEHPAKRFELGSEPTPREYVSHMVEVFREVRRVLRPDGTLWLNIGDSYASKAGGYNSTGSAGKTSQARISKKTQSAVLKGRQRKPPPGIKRKDLIGVPWMLAFALRDDGWWLRSEIIWHKPNPLPESVTDRPTKAHEQIFLLTKSPDYFYDHVAIQEAAVYGDHPRNGTPDMVVQAPGQPMQAGITKVRSQGNKPGPRNSSAGGGRGPKNGARTPDDGRNERSGDPRKHGFNERWREQQAGKGWGRSGGVGFHERWDPAEEAGSLPGTRNKRSVWTIATHPFPEAHFATFPPALVEPCILAGTSSGGCCSGCGSPYNRILDTHYENPGNRSTNGPRSLEQRHETAGFAVRLEKVEETLGWEPTCSCDPGPTVPCTVLDPFNGAGTTGLVAARTNRHYIGAELYLEYAALAGRRIEADAPLLNHVTLVDLA
jgi:DNA modification methylase